MAEVSSSRANKLAAARKKLREFQQSRGQAPDVVIESKLNENWDNTFHSQESQIKEDALSDMLNNSTGSMNFEVLNQQYFSPITNTEDAYNTIEQSFNPNLDISVGSNSNGTGRLSQYFGSVNDEKQSRFIESNSNRDVFPNPEEMINGTLNSTSSSALKPVEKQFHGISENSIKSATGATQFVSDKLEVQSVMNELEQLKLTNQELLEKLNSYNQEKEMNLLMSGPLKEQLQSQAQTIGILVAEKTELQSALSQCELAAKAKACEVEEFVTKIQQMNQQIQLLELEANQKDESKSSLESNNGEMSLKLDMLERDLEKLRKEIKDKDEIHLELQSKLDKRNAEMSELQNRFLSTDNELQLCKIRICQLSSNEEDESISKVTQEKGEIEKQLNYYKEAFLKLEKEKEDIGKEYNTQVETLRYHLQCSNKRVSELEVESAEKSNSISNLSSKVADLEKEQENNRWREKYQEEWCQEKADLISEVNTLEAVSKNLESVNSSLREEIQSLQSTQHKLEAELKGNAEKQREYSQLLVTMESDKVAASRATSQNLLLKKQNEEYEKMNQSLSVKISELLEAVSLKESQLSQCQGQVQELVELTATLRQEIGNQKEMGSLQSAPDTGPDAKGGRVTAPEHNEVDKESRNLSNGDISGKENVSVEEYCKLQLAMEALEVKFNDSIRKVATLTEEKHLLEHLVTQLHSETETIEEYIALYRMQRGLLRQKAEEKDQIIQQISQDRELLRTKLTMLEDLVNNLSGGQERRVDIIPEVDTVTNVASADHVDTTRQIKALLSEIGASSILHNSLASDTFHPCSLCSGRLLHL